jgi:hypothetical protein
MASYGAASSSSASSLRKFSAIKHVVVIASDSLNADLSSALKVVVDEYLERTPPLISQPQLPRWKTDDGSYHMKMMKAHALSLVQFQKVRRLPVLHCNPASFVLRCKLFLSQVVSGGRH